MEKHVTENIITHTFEVAQSDRIGKLNQNPTLLWFTGLSGSGKSTLSNAVEKLLFDAGFITYALDGDNIRKGICNNLSFSDADRTENIRRIGEVAGLMLDAGLIVCASFVSPFEADRKLVRSIVGAPHFAEIFVSTPLAECERRDVKGLYAKARAGKIPNFTGISSPYQEPTNPELSIDTTNLSLEKAAKTVFDFITPKLR